MGLFLRNTIFLRDLIPFIIVVSIIGSIWDIWATKHKNKDAVWLWQFNGRQTIGIKFLGLPVEEYLFYLASSVYVIFMWEGIKQMTLDAHSGVTIVLVVSVWTLIAILLPYKFGLKGDKLFG